MRIIHFSDVHFGCLPRNLSALLDKRILGGMSFFLRRRAGFNTALLAPAVSLIKSLSPDWIICTGDITSVGSPEEFDASLAGLSPLLEGDFGKRMIFVPGNHDVYVRNRACRQALEQAFVRLNAGRWALSDLPQRLHASRVSFLVIDECCCTNWLLSSGALSKIAGDRLREWLAEPRAPGEKRILVGHFPVRDARGRPLGWRRRLAEGAIVDAALKDGRLDVSLCGHEHQPYLRTEPSGAMEICAGALLAAAKINVLDFCEPSACFSQFWVDVRADTAAPIMIPAGLVPVAR